MPCACGGVVKRQPVNLVLSSSTDKKKKKHDKKKHDKKKHDKKKSHKKSHKH
jgi:hypothetical protein